WWLQDERAVRESVRPERDVTRTLHRAVKTLSRATETGLPKTRGFNRIEFFAHGNVPAGWKVVEAAPEGTIPAHQEGEVRAVFRVASAGLHVVTGDIEFAGRKLREWTEAPVRVRE